MKVKNRLIHIGLILLGLMCFGLAGLMIRSFSGRWVEDRGPTAKAGPALSITEASADWNADASNEPVETWVVYVTGAVKAPGVYHLPSGSRVYHLIESAGGMTSDADDVAVNLAAPLADGAHIHVPLRPRLIRSPVESSGAAKVRSSTVTVLSSPKAISGKGVSAAKSTSKVDINSATSEELQCLPGVGPKTAAAIISYREKIGRFRSVEELLKVKGIGPKKLETVRSLVTVR